MEIQYTTLSHRYQTIRRYNIFLKNISYKSIPLSLIMSIRLKKIFTYPIGICAEEWVSEGIILLLPKLRSNCKSHIRLFAIWTVWFVYPRSGTYTNEYHWKDKTNDANRLRYPCQAPICLSINRRETRYLARNRLFLYTIDAVYNFQYGK